MQAALATLWGRGTGPWSAGLPKASTRIWERGKRQGYANDAKWVLTWNSWSISNSMYLYNVLRSVLHFLLNGFDKRSQVSSGRWNWIWKVVRAGLHWALQGLKQKQDDSIIVHALKKRDCDPTLKTSFQFLLSWCGWTAGLGSWCPHWMQLNAPGSQRSGKSS